MFMIVCQHVPSGLHLSKDKLQRYLRVETNLHKFEIHFFVETQRQSGGADCGVFAITFATALC